MNVTILTGASRGLGSAMAEQLLKHGHRLLTISRHTADLWVVQGADLEQWPVDLADPAPVADRLEAWLRKQELPSPASVTLINNAAVVSPPVPLSGSQRSDLTQVLRVGLEAPMLLTAAFLRATHGWNAPRRVLFISSGLGRRAMASSAPYCAAKAGLDHLARALALEEATHMQVQLRSADPGLFPDRERFVALHAAGQLDSPAQAAAKVLAYLARPDFGAQPVADVRDA